MTSLVEPGEAIETADEVLSRPEYQEAQPSLLERALERVFEWLADIFAPAVGNFGSVTIGYVILAIAVAAAAFFLWKFWQRFDRKPSADDEVVKVEVEVSERLSRAEWLSRAEAAEAAGNWDIAVHARYHALTTGLADNEILAPEVSTTSGEHRSNFAATEGDPGRVGRFAAATDRYEEVWFGGNDAERPDRDVLESVDRELLT